MKAEKELLKKEIKDKLNQFHSFLVMQYAKLSANAANDFRRQIGKGGGDVEIARKRILIKAAEDVGISLDREQLGGHVGIVFLGDDPIEMTKTVFKFSQERGKAIQVLAGRFEGTLYSGEDVEQLSNLPNKDGMRAQLLGLFEAPMSQTLAVIEALLTSVPHCLENKVKLEDQGSQEDESLESENVVEAE